MKTWCITLMVLWLAASCFGQAHASGAAPAVQPATQSAEHETSHDQPATTEVADDDAAESKGQKKGEKKKSSDGDKPAEGKIEKAAVTTGEVAIGGKTIKYRATAANMPMKDDGGKLKATVFFVAYERLEDADAATSRPTDDTAPLQRDPGRRPVTFVFNGGPGAAAVWLHLGTAGPRRIDLTEEGEAIGPPYRLVDNNSSWLEATDMVFIDPVGTGFSRPAEGEKGEQFYGVREDVRWVADFIRLYITHYERWISPMFLAGESYGTTRAAGLSEHLLERYGIALNGIALISTVLNFQTLRFDEGNDLPFPLYLPTYAAIAWYHQRLSAELTSDLDTTLQQVERWTVETYIPALALGDALPDEQRRAIVDTLARFTGLPAELVSRCNLRITPSTFQKALLADERKLIGRFDGRITGFDPEPVSTWPAYDPSLSRYLSVYSATFNDYVRRSLKYESVLPYEVLSDRVRPWKFGEEGMGYLNVADNLRSAMVKNPRLKILFASGYYDLATPYFATRYTVDHLDLGAQLRANIAETHYPGGHMMYHHQPSLQKLGEDMARFIGSAWPGDGRQ